MLLASFELRTGRHSQLPSSLRTKEPTGDSDQEPTQPRRAPVADYRVALADVA